MKTAIEICCVQSSVLHAWMHLTAHTVSSLSPLYYLRHFALTLHSAFSLSKEWSNFQVHCSIRAYLVVERFLFEWKSGEPSQSVRQSPFLKNW